MYFMFYGGIISVSCYVFYYINIIVFVLMLKLLYVKLSILYVYEMKNFWRIIVIKK